MIFGAKNLFSTNEILDSLLDSGEVKGLNGAVSIVCKEGRKTVQTGKIFLRNEYIYAVQIDGKNIPIAKRVETGRLVASEDLQDVIRRAGSEYNPRVVDLLLEGQLISEKPVRTYVKDHFIETLGEILSWKNCIGEWQPNTTTSDFVMPFVSLDKMRELFEKRSTLRNDFAVSVQKFFRESEIPNITFKSNVKDTSKYSPEIQSILRMSNTMLTIDEMVEKTGLTNFSIFQTLVSLWKQGLVDLKLGGINLPFDALATSESLSSPNLNAAKAVDEAMIVPLIDDQQELASDGIITESIDDMVESVTPDAVITEEPAESNDDLLDTLTSEDQLEEVILTDDNLENKNTLKESVESPDIQESEEEYILNDEPIVSGTQNSNENSVLIDEIDEIAELEALSRDFPAYIAEDLNESEPLTADREDESFNEDTEIPTAYGLAPIVQASPLAPLPAKERLAVFTENLNLLKESANDLEIVIEEIKENRITLEQEVQEQEISVVEAREYLTTVKRTAEDKLRVAELSLKSAQNKLTENTAKEAEATQQSDEVYADIESLIKSFTI